MLKHLWFPRLSQMKQRHRRYKFNCNYDNRSFACWNGLIIPCGGYYDGKYARFMARRVLHDRQDVYPSFCDPKTGRYVFGIGRYIAKLGYILIQDAQIVCLENEQDKIDNPGLFLIRPDFVVDYWTHYKFVGGKDIWQDSCNDWYEKAYAAWYRGEFSLDKGTHDLNPIRLGADGSISCEDIENEDSEAEKQS